MNRKSTILMGMCICAIALGMHLSGFADLGNLALAFAGVLLMFTIALTFAILAEKDQADG